MPSVKNKGLEGANEALRELAVLQSQVETLTRQNLDLAKANEGLAQERDHLKTLLEGVVPSVQGATNVSQVAEILKEEMIAHRQLEILRDRSTERELTLEETKKVETYYKILAALRSKPKAETNTLEQVSDADLLKVADLFKKSS